MDKYECADCGVVFGVTGHEGCVSPLSENGLHHPVLCGDCGEVMVVDGEGSLALCWNITR